MNESSAKKSPEIEAAQEGKKKKTVEVLKQRKKYSMSYNGMININFIAGADLR